MPASKALRMELVMGTSSRMDRVVVSRVLRRGCCADAVVVLISRSRRVICLSMVRVRLGDLRANLGIICGNWRELQADIDLFYVNAFCCSLCCNRYLVFSQSYLVIKRVNAILFIYRNLQRF